MTTRRGFTLIEVVVAITITAFIGMVIASTFSTTIASKEVMEQQSEKYRMVRVAMARMAREIGAAYISDRYDPKRYRDAFDRPSNFIGNRDKLIFTSLAHQRLYADAKESDQMVVQYSVKRSPDKKAKSRDDLIRQEKTLIEERIDRFPTEDTSNILFEGIKKLEFKYWNSERQQWEDEWDTRRSERKSVLPTRVMVTIITVDDAGKEVKYSTQTRIMLNTEFPRFQ
jgi:general secretion pathway protein J